MWMVGKLGPKTCQLITFALLYVTALAAVGMLAVSNYLAMSGYLIAAGTIVFLMRVMNTWWPMAAYALQQRLVVKILNTRVDYLPEGEDGRLAWIRTVAGDAGMTATFEPGPDGTPNQVLVLTDMHGGVIGVQPR
jgi:hypothetical protein